MPLGPRKMPRNKFDLPDLHATQALARRFVPFAKAGFVLTLQGDLGTGKTEFARSFLWILGVSGDIPSPTFTILQTYTIEHLEISHFDLYRIRSASELDELGWDDALAAGMTIVEWPERAQGRLPSERINLYFSLDAD
jgi:tRNA threonylcarbamoyl adenosine modification protein YjeE